MKKDIIICNIKISDIFLKIIKLNKLCIDLLLLIINIVLLYKISHCINFVSSWKYIIVIKILCSRKLNDVRIIESRETC